MAKNTNRKARLTRELRAAETQLSSLRQLHDLATSLPMVEHETKTLARSVAEMEYEVSYLRTALEAQS